MDGTVETLGALRERDEEDHETKRRREATVQDGPGTSATSKARALEMYSQIFSGKRDTPEVGAASMQNLFASVRDYVLDEKGDKMLNPTARDNTEFLPGIRLVVFCHGYADRWADSIGECAQAAWFQSQSEAAPVFVCIDADEAIRKAWVAASASRDICVLLVRFFHRASVQKWLPAARTAEGPLPALKPLSEERYVENCHYWNLRRNGEIAAFAASSPLGDDETDAKFAVRLGDLDLHDPYESLCKIFAHRARKADA